MRLPASVGYLARPMPLGVVQAVANAGLARVLAKHPRLFDRLGEHGTKLFAFTPTDLPMTFVVTPARGTIVVLRPEWPRHAQVNISGPIVTLLALAEGRLDGDAEFFARDLAVDGDMEAIVALRNAMDDCRIDLPSDLAPAGGILRRPVGNVLRAFRAHLLDRGARKWN